MRAARNAPKINSYILVAGIAQDELGHAHIAYRLVRDLGVDVEELLYERDARDFRHPTPSTGAAGLVADDGGGQRLLRPRGLCLLEDIFQNSSYGPWKRALVEVTPMKRLVELGCSWLRFSWRLPTYLLSTATATRETNQLEHAFTRRSVWAWTAH